MTRRHGAADARANARNTSIPTSNRPSRIGRPFLLRNGAQRSGEVIGRRQRRSALAACSRPKRKERKRSMSDFTRKPSSRRYLAFRRRSVRAVIATAGAVLLLTFVVGKMSPDTTSRVLAMGRRDAAAQDGLEQRAR